MAKTVKARWVGAFEAELPDGTVLVPHETVAEISAGEAQESDHWQPVGSKKGRQSEDES